MAELRRQFVGELGRMLSEEYGGTPNEWIPVLAPALLDSLQRYRDAFIGQPLHGFREWIVEERDRVVRQVFASKGLSIPMQIDPANLGARIQFNALTSCNAAFPHAVSALQELQESGMHIHMASSQE